MKKSENPKDSAKNQRIQVFARCRPTNCYEKKQFSPCVVEVNPERKEVKVQDDKMINKTFVFDKVFGSDTKQISVYKAVVGPLIREVLMGYNCTVFAYGQTGTGKTFTMEGERSSVTCSWDEDPNAGIIPRSLHQLFEELSKEENVEFSVHVSFLELYNEELFDLLSQNDISKLRLFEDGSRKGSVVIQGLEEIKVNSKDEVYVILEQGTARRQKASTLLNATSSRSHTVFSVTVHIKENTIDGEELLKTGKLNLVDLAGSENIGRSGASQKTAREAGSINQSLLTLGRVITALVEKAPHIPYRESKLTRLLQDSLGGHTKTSIIATVSPALCNIEETISTLDYAQRAKNITIKPEVNQKMTKKALIKEYTSEIEKLRKDLVALRTNTGFYIDLENYNFMLQEIASKSNKIAELEAKLEVITAETEKIEEMFKEAQDKLQATEEELDCTSQKYTATAEKLAKTKEKLKSTKKVLGETMISKCKMEFINEIHDKYEKKLFEQAQVALQAAEESSNDVSALHNKIERKQAVENSNAETSQVFRSQFQLELVKLDDIVTSLVNQQVGALGALQTDIGDILHIWSAHTASMTSALHSFINLQDSHINSLSKFFKTNMENRINTCYESIGTSVEQKQEELMMWQDSFRDMFSQMQNSLVSQLVSLEKLLQNTREAICTKVENQKIAIKSGASMHRQLTQNIQNKFDTFSSHPQNLTSSLQEYSSAVTNESNILSEVWLKQKKGILDYISCMDNAVGDYMSRIASRSLQLNTKCEKVVKVSEDDATIIRGELQKLISVAQSFENTSSEFLESLELNPNDDLMQVEQILHSVVAKPEDLKQHVSEFLEKSKLNQIKNSMAVIDILNDEKERTVALFKEHDELIKGQKSTFKSAVQNEVSQIKEHSTRFKIHTDSHETIVKDTKQKLFDQGEVLKEGLLSRDIDVEKFVSEMLLQDVPTGTTPQRKNYSFPKKLVPIPLSQEKVLEDFELQLEDLETPLLSQSQDSSSDEILVKEVSDEIQTQVFDRDISSEESCSESDSSVSSYGDVNAKHVRNKENWPTQPSSIPKRVPGSKKNVSCKKVTKHMNSSLSQRLPLQSSNENISCNK